MKTQFPRIKKSSFFATLILLCAFISHAQQTTLKHSYTFDDGQITDVAGGADGKAFGGTFENGMYVTSKNGDYIELPAEKIKINTFESITLEAYIIAGEGNPELTMLSYFGNTSGINGSDYLFQTVCGRGQSKTSISTKEYQEPWTAENSISCNQLGDNQLHHIVTTFDNSDLRFYIDGLLIGTQPTEERPENVIANLGTQYAYLAKSGYINDWTWLGKIDEFNIYEGVMSEAEVLQNAEAYIPDLDLERVKSMTAYSNLVVDRSGEFDHPITGEVVYFAEIMPDETDGDRWVDQLLVFSEGPVFEWGDYSTMVRASISSGFLDVSDGNEVVYNKATKLVVDLGHVIQCWISLDVPNNSYSVYAKTLDMDDPVVIYENAKFIKEVSSLTHWSLIHNRANEGALAMNTLSEVDNVGIYPTDYTPSEDKAFFIADQVIPEGARVIDNPMTGMKRGSMEIKKIVLTDSTTELYFHTTYRPRYWVSIPSKTFIKSVDNDEKLFIKRAEGIKIDARHHTASYGYSEYKLVFPALKKGTTSFDYGEANEGGNWFMYDIQLTPKPKSEGIYGTWFSTTNGDWVISLFKDAAVYDAKVWEYDQALTNKKKGEIKLTSGNESVTLAYKLKKDQLLIGPSKKELTALDHDSDYSRVPKPTNPAKFEAPVFKMDTAILSGYLRGYRPIAGNTTATVYVDNVLTGEQENYLLKVAEDGSFLAKIPMTYPQSVYVRNDFGIIYSLFLEPGEETFMMIDYSNGTKNLVMGKNARMIAENLKYQENFANRGIYNEYRNNVLEWSPEEFKAFCLDKMAEDLELLEGMKDKVSDRFYQVKQYELTYGYLRDILHYHFTVDGAKRQANQEVNERTEMPADPAFYSFLSDEIVNNELAVLGNSFENFMNALMYSPAVRPGNIRYTIFDLAEDAKQLTDLSNDQTKLLESFHEASDGVAELDEAFNKIYGEIQSATLRKYNEQFQELAKDTTSQEHPILRLVNLISESDSLSNDETRFITGARDHYSKENVKSYLEFMKKHQTEMNEIFRAASKIRQTSMLDTQIELMEENLDIRPGLASDIISSQNYLRGVVSEMTPMSPAMLTSAQQQIQTPFISSYLSKANQATIAKIEANKNAGGYTNNDVPETEADKVFDAIVSKYKGKVVYVDFWATWCGPCRSSMNRQKSMKEALMKEEKDIVFVYITNPSSPENTYKNMIPNIKGEHYRVSQDEWNHISSKFNITGIPHYAIVNKNGEVVDGDASREPTILMKKFEELMAEEIASEE